MYIQLIIFFFFKQKTAYEMRISDWTSDVCSSDLGKRLKETRHGATRSTGPGTGRGGPHGRLPGRAVQAGHDFPGETRARLCAGRAAHPRSEEHTSELQSLMRSSYHVFCLSKKKSTPVKTDHDFELHIQYSSE